MKIPTIRGLIDRRLLVNFRVEPGVLERILPSPFRPKLVNGKGMAGVCLIRLAQIRPRLFPAFVGVSSENAAHRIAVEWDSSEGATEGVYIPRRDISSRLNMIAGGRVFPGEHNLASFEVREEGRFISISLRSHDGRTRLMVEVSAADSLPDTSIFRTLAEASAFFERGALGYSATSRPGEFDGLELRTFQWRVEPVHVTQVSSSFFEEPDLFPPGSVELDCALLMRKIGHEWHGRDTLTCR